MEFERAVYARDYSGAVQQLIVVLEAIDKDSGGTAFANPRASVRHHTRFAAAVTALLADPGFGLDSASFARLMGVRRNLSLLFAASGFGDARHLPFVVGKRSAGGVAYDPPLLHKMLLGLDLACGPAMMAKVLEKLEPVYSLPVVVGLLRQRIVLTQQEDATRAYLLSLAPTVLEASELSGQWVNRSLGPWFLCSYAAHPRKHDVKAALNRAYRRHLAAVGIGDRKLPVPRRRAKRPTLLVIGEIFRSGHAMQRCYSAFISQAAGCFRAVLMTRKQERDEGAAAQFDEAITATDDTEANVREIARIDPDMIFFPSVGMRTWSILLANLRLAPIQLMSIGHPASSFSSTMDYLVLGRDVASEDAEIGERVVVLDCPGAQFVPHREDPYLTPNIREQPVPLRIAVPAHSMKLTAPFIAACQRIMREAGRLTEFHFFPNEQGAFYRAVENTLASLLPGVRVFSTTAYPKYMGRLNDCDIALSPFPFGSANSAVDAALQCVPMVAFEGTEPHARTDRRVLRAVGLPEWLLACDEESYVAATLRLIRDDVERVRLSRVLQGARERLFVDDQRRHPTAFIDALNWIYENHEVIQADPRRFWWPEDRVALKKERAEVTD